MAISIQEENIKLQEKINLLLKENSRLTERAEDIELIALTSESVKDLNDPQEIFLTVLEKIAITKDIPYCAFGSLSDSKIKISAEYATFTNQTTGQKEIRLTKSHLQQLKKTQQILSVVNSRQSVSPLSLRINGFRSHSTLILPFSCTQVPAGIILLAHDDSDPTRLANTKPILKQVVNIVTSRLDYCALLNKLNALNKELEHKVAVRTKALEKMNEALQEENLQRQQAHSKLAEKQSHLETLLNVTAQIHRSIDIEQVFKKITESTVYAFGYNTAIIFTRIDPSFTFRIQVITSRSLLTKIDQIIGFPIQNYTVKVTPHTNPAIGKCLRGEMFVTDDLYEIAHPFLNKKMCRLLQKLRSTEKYILLPLQIPTEIVGAILLSSSKPDVLERDLEILKIFAHTAAQAIQNATLHNQSKQVEKALQKKTIEQQRLIDTAKKLTNSLDTQMVLGSFVQGAREILKADECVIYSYDPNEEYLTPVISAEPSTRQTVMSTLIPKDRSLAGQAIITGKGLIFNVPQNEALYFPIPGMPQLSQKRILVVPLWEETRIIGTMRLNRTGKDFTEEDLSLAETFAAYASSALTNAKKHQELVHEITLRRQSEQALKISEERYRTITETARDVILTIDDNNQILFVNRAITNLLGYTPEEITGEPIRKLVAPKLQDSFHRGLSNYRHTGKKSVRWEGFESVAHHKDGREIAVEVSFNSYQVGSKQYFTGIIRDITERKQMHSALRNLATSFAKMSGVEFYEAVCQHLITALDMDYGYVGELSEKSDEIRVIGGYAKDRPLTGFIYSLRNTPCEKVIDQELRCYPDGVLDDFPDVPFFHDWKARSYLGTPLFNSTGQPLGICVLVSKKPLENQSLAESMITVFAERIATEIEREQSTLKVTQSLTELQWIDRINKTALTGKPIHEIVRQIREAIKKTCDAQAVTIYLYDPVHKKLVMQPFDTGNTLVKKIESFTGIHITDFAPLLKQGDRITEAFTTGKGFLLSNQDEIASLYREYTENQTLHKMIPRVMRLVKPHIIGIIPLKYKGDPIGLVTFNTTTLLNQQDLTRLTRFSNQFTATLMWASAEKKIKQSLQEKELLLREIHHRVKNNLQVISSLMKLQTDSVTDKAVLNSLKESQMRIRSLALVHEKLYQSPDLSVIDFKTYLVSLTHDLISFYDTQHSSIEIVNKIPEIYLNIETAIPCGLIINELVTNSIKHAFPNRKKGTIEIHVKTSSGSKVEMLVKDNGVGLPENLQWRQAKTLGLQLVKMLAEDQLQGKVHIRRKPGTEFRISFPVPSS